MATKDKPYVPNNKGKYFAFYRTEEAARSDAKNAKLAIQSLEHTLSGLGALEALDQKYNLPDGYIIPVFMVVRERQDVETPEDPGELEGLQEWGPQAPTAKKGDVPF